VEKRVGSADETSAAGNISVPAACDALPFEMRVAFPAREEVMPTSVPTGYHPGSAAPLALLTLRERLAALDHRSECNRP
jgi:hypothetical protein